jgi:hypothetical protein
MAYRVPMMPRYMREGSDGLDLTRTRVMDEAATQKLIGNGLDVAHVTVDQSGEQPTLVTWQRPRTPEQRQLAEQLLGFTVQHA